MQVRSLQMLAAVVVAGAALSAQAVDFSPGPSTDPWLGFMNVTELPSNGGAYVFGSGWGIIDLRAEFNDGASTLTLYPNNINDPSPFWYTPEGQPGAAGNKNMDAVLYIQPADGSLTGMTVTFKGSVISNTLTAAHVSKAFIRDFAPDYSSFNEAAVDLTPGNFSISLGTAPDPARHVQYGFYTVGPCVWVTDAGLFGSVVISTASVSACVGDLNGDTFVDDSDFVIFAGAYSILDCADPSMPIGCPSDLNNDGFVDDSDFVIFAAAYEALLCP